MIDITEFASILVLKCKWYLSGNKTAHLSIYRKSQFYQVQRLKTDYTFLGIEHLNFLGLIKFFVWG